MQKKISPNDYKKWVEELNTIRATLSLGETTTDAETGEKLSAAEVNKYLSAIQEIRSNRYGQWGTVTTPTAAYRGLAVLGLVPQIEETNDSLLTICPNDVSSSSTSGFSVKNLTTSYSFTIFSRSFVGGSGFSQRTSFSNSASFSQSSSNSYFGTEGSGNGGCNFDGYSNTHTNSNRGTTDSNFSQSTSFSDRAVYSITSVSYSNFSDTYFGKISSTTYTGYAVLT